MYVILENTDAKTLNQKKTSYNIYYGLNGGFSGSCQYQYTIRNITYNDAVDDAYEGAVAVYESYAGLHGIPNWDDAVQDFCNDNNMDPTEVLPRYTDDIEEYYNDEREEWLVYYVIETDRDPNNVDIVYA